MALFVLFVFGAVILGAGAMLSPAWPTKQPRIALLAALALALIMGGTIFYAMLFGWDTLVIDYLLFALVVSVFLGGTLSTGQLRAEKKGETLEDVDQGWPGPQDLSVVIVIGIVMLIPIFILPTVLGTHAQELGLQAFTVRDGGTFDTFAPIADQSYLAPPAFSALIAYLSQQLGQDIQLVQFAVASIVALLNIWLAYDMGAEIQSKRLGRAMALAMLFGVATFSSLLTGYFTELTALLFLQAFIIFALRYTRHQYPMDAIGGGLMLGAIVITNFDMAVVAVLGYIPWLVTMWFADPAPTRRTWVVMALGIPLIAIIAISPWLANLPDVSLEALGERGIDNLVILLGFHGWWVVPVAILGLWIGWARRDSVVLLAGGWLVMTAEFSLTGGVTGLFPFLTDFANPTTVARMGPIIPYTILAGIGLLWTWESVLSTRMGGIGYRGTYALATIAGIVVVAIGLLAPSLFRDNKSLLNLPPAYASGADIDVLDWVKANTEFEGTRLLNVPTNEGQWVVVVTERDTVFSPTIQMSEEDEALLDFWQNPSDPQNAELLQAHGITHIVIPQIIGNSSSHESAWRWDDPPSDTDIMTQLADADYLELVYENDGAQVYGVR